MIWEKLVADNPSVTEFRQGLAWSYHNAAILQTETDRHAEALALYERSSAVWERLAREHPDSLEFAVNLGKTLENMALIDLAKRRWEDARAKFTRAIECQRKVLSAGPDQPDSRRSIAGCLTKLIEANEGLGLADLAALARRELAELEAADPVKAAIDGRLAAVLDGQSPDDDAQRLMLAYRAYEKSLHLASARLYAEALANDPKLGNDRQAQHLYNAACAASLAASGQSKDGPPPDNAAKAKLRRQAREWLHAELAAWHKVFDAGPAEIKARIAPTLEHWKADADLASIRDEQELAKLPELERASLEVLLARRGSAPGQSGGRQNRVKIVAGQQFGSPTNDRKVRAYSRTPRNAPHTPRPCKPLT